MFSAVSNDETMKLFVISTVFCLQIDYKLVELRLT